MAFEVNKGKDFIYMIPVIILIIFIYLMMYKDGKLDEKLPEELKSEIILNEEVKKNEKESVKQKEEKKVINNNNNKMNLETGKNYKTDSGLEYKVLKLGDGPKPEATSTVEVHYEGTLLDGTIFDSSYARGEKISFGLNQVIRGWTEGLQLMPVGSKFKFTIPANLAYGSAEMPGIPANSTLIFTVELFAIK